MEDTRKPALTEPWCPKCRNHTDCKKENRTTTNSEGSKMEVRSLECLSCRGRMFKPIEEKMDGLIHMGFITCAAVLGGVYYGVKQEMKPALALGVTGLIAAFISLWFYLNYRKFVKWAKEQGSSMEELHADYKMAQEEALREIRRKKTRLTWLSNRNFRALIPAMRNCSEIK